MKKFAAFKMLFAILFVLSTNGMEAARDSSAVNISDLKPAEVLVALWVNASGAGINYDAGPAKVYLFSMAAKWLTISDAEEYLTTSKSLDYFSGRKISVDFSEGRFASYGYDQNHGPLRAQKVVDALRKLLETGALTEARIHRCYVSVWDKIVEIENIEKQRLLDANKRDASLALHKYYSVRSDADSVGNSLARATSSEELVKAVKLANDLREFHLNGVGNRFTIFAEFMGKEMPVPQAAAPQGHQPPQATAPTDAPQRANFSTKTDNLFKGMFGKKAPEKAAPIPPAPSPAPVQTAQQPPQETQSPQQGTEFSDGTKKMFKGMFEKAESRKN